VNIPVLVLLTVAAAPKAPSPLVLVRDLPLPGGPTRFDYQWVDGERRRLYIAHLGADSLLVFDLDGQKVVGCVGGLPSIHGVVAAPEKGRLFATATGDKKLAIIDDHSLEVVARIPAGEYPNGLAYAPKQGKVYVSNNTGLGVGVVDVANAKPLPGIDIGGGAGNTQYDAGSGHVFAAIHKVAALAEIDPSTDQVVAQHALPGVHGCHGLLVDAARRHAFAACDGKVLVAYDLDKHRVLGTLPIPKQPDVLALDAPLGRVYVSSASGFAAAFEVTPGGELRSLGQTMVGPNAHTVAVDPRTHYVFFPLEDVGGRPLLRVMKPKEAPSASPR
jgi:DNA-binding beta-propeller fold protein YncE